MRNGWPRTDVNALCYVLEGSKSSSKLLVGSCFCVSCVGVGLEAASSIVPNEDLASHCQLLIEQTVMI